MKPAPKPADESLYLQGALNNVVALSWPKVRDQKKPWLREYAQELFQPALDAMADEAFTPDEFICMMSSMLLMVECNRTGNWKRVPALSSASELISTTSSPSK